MIILKNFDIFRNRNAVVVYFSDHGEDIYDSGEYRGRVITDSPNKNILHYQYEIPFVVWVSNKFTLNNPQKVKDIEMSVEKPFMTDNICHMFFNLTNLKPTVYNPKRDILSTQYISPRRLTNGTTDYDKIMKYNN